MKCLKCEKRVPLALQIAFQCKTCCIAWCKECVQQERDKHACFIEKSMKDSLNHKESMLNSNTASEKLKQI